MKTPDDIMKALEQCLFCVPCDPCPYIEKSGDGCQRLLLNDAVALIRQLQDVNRALRTELATNHIGDTNKKVEEKPWGQYWQNICDLNARQEAKGKKKYGEPLEDNTTLTTTQRIEHAQEESIDLLKYLEHLKQVADDGITANDYQRAAMRTAGDNEENFLLNGVMGLCGEAGEVIDLVKKHLHQGHDLDKEALILECGDCAWYLALIMSAIDCKMGDMLVKNIRKLEERYPAGFDKARSIHREENNG